MPVDRISWRAPLLDRRRLLLSAGAALVAVPLAACTSSPGSLTPTGSATPGVDDALRATVATDELRLLGMYAAARKAHPSLATVLKVGDRHGTYAAALDPAAPRPSTIGAPPSGAIATLQWLQDAERAAATARVTQCGKAQDQQLVRTLALIGSGCVGAAAVVSQARISRAGNG